MKLEFRGNKVTAAGKCWALSLILTRALSGGWASETVKEAPLALVARVCSGCHTVPGPEVLPQGVWSLVITQMRQHMIDARFPFHAEELAQIQAYYIAHSPVELPRIPDDYQEAGLSFATQSLGLTSPGDRPEVTSLRFVDLDGDGSEDDIIITDNLLSSVSWLRLERGEWIETILGEFSAPVNTTPLDYNRDGHLDLVVSSMGIMRPNDELIGELHILQASGDGSFRSRRILEGVPRITDCAPADYDGDGDVDFVIAMFGWRKTGAIGYLEQVAPDQFALSTPVTINGVLRVIANESNQDGRPDFVALFSQQHEVVMQFVNQGKGLFRSLMVSPSKHPSYGSSSLRTVDLDGDGDEDILSTNGDMMDENPEHKPYHGVRWLENADGTYTVHELARMPGCYDAEPADLDGDGDLDIVFSSLNFHWPEHDFPSLAWLENQGEAKKFVPRRIAYSPTNLATIAVGDANNDGRPDIIGGGMHVPGPLERIGRLTLWLGKK
jgi:FG-GAP-like repeat